LLFTGRSLLAEEGLAWGFFNRLIAPETVLAESIALATDIAQGPTFAHAMTKKMLHGEWAMTVDDAIDAEAEAQAVCMETQDFHRAYHAFAAKQKPKFEGD
jgi:enoyl-CoA hydratase/carnithine racemase